MCDYLETLKKCILCVYIIIYLAISASFFSSQKIINRKKFILSIGPRIAWRWSLKLDLCLLLAETDADLL